MPETPIKAPQTLIDYFNSMGLQADWNGVEAVKWRADGCYVLLLCTLPKTPDTEETPYWIVDIAGSTRNGPWSVQNDSSDPISMAEWKKVKIVPECDWYRFLGEEGYPVARKFRR